MILNKNKLLLQLRKSKYLFGGSTSKSSNRDTMLHTANRRMAFVPIVFLVCRMWGTIRFLFGAHAPVLTQNPEFLWIIPLQVCHDTISSMKYYI